MSITDPWIITILTTLLGFLCYLQAVKDREKNQVHWEKRHTYEPVLGGAWHSFLTVPVFRVLRLVYVDMFSKHFVFVVGSGSMVHVLAVPLCGTPLGVGAIPAVALVVIHLLAWVNWVVPEVRLEFFKAVLELIKAAADWIRAKKPV